MRGCARACEGGSGGERGRQGLREAKRVREGTRWLARVCACAEVGETECERLRPNNSSRIYA